MTDKKSHLDSIPLLNVMVEYENDDRHCIFLLLEEWFEILIVSFLFNHIEVVYIF